MTPSLSREALSVLAEARQAYIAVDAASGPHVTPDLYAYAAGRIWFAAADSTVKAKVLVRHERAAIVVVGADRSVCLAGTIERFDPASPRDLVTGARALPDLATALASYASRNVPDLVAFGRDLLTGRLGWSLPPRRILFGLTPDDGPEVSGDATPTPTSDVAVVAFPGPTAAPARWDHDNAELHLPVSSCPVAVGSSTPLAIVADEYVAPGPAAKQGILLRGTGRHVAPGRLSVDVLRVVTWDGVETDSAATSTAEARPADRTLLADPP
jgi:hypothetical protein